MCTLKVKILTATDGIIYHSRPVLQHNVGKTVLMNAANKNSRNLASIYYV